MRNLCLILVTRVLRRLTWLLLFSTLCPLMWADTTLDTETVKKIVVFLYSPNSDGTDANVAQSLGTGFFVATFVKNNPLRGSILLITARHIVEPNWATCSPEPQPQSDRRIYIRLNNKQYDSEKDSTGVSYLPVDLVKNGAKRYFVSDDNKVDAAVIILGWEDWGKVQEKYDFVPLRLSLFASPDEIHKFKIGDSVASAGLVPGRSGEQRNYPFFKFGEISNIPDEPF